MTDEMPDPNAGDALAYDEWRGLIPPDEEEQPDEDEGDDDEWKQR